MSATWYLVKYLPDLKRREPRNVGVLLQTPDGWLSRFIAEGSDGAITGRVPRKVIKSADTYKTWVSYFKRKAAEGSWGDVERMQRRRVANYYAERGGHLVADTPPWRDVLNQLYVELVDEGPKPAASAAPEPSLLDVLLSKVDLVLEAAGVAPQREVRVPAKFGEHVIEVPFRYAYENGQPHLMDIVHSHMGPDKAAADARELRARVEAAQLAGSATSFVTFYASSILAAANMDQVLYPVEEVSTAVDVDHERDAVGHIKHKMRHGIDP